MSGKSSGPVLFVGFVSSQFFARFPPNIKNFQGKTFPNPTFFPGLIKTNANLMGF